MSSNVDIEQLQTTKSEKLLSAVLTVFLLIGGVWSYQEIDDKVRRDLPLRNPTAAERAVLEARGDAQTRLFRAQGRVRQERSNLELRREAYRTALDADEPAAALRARYLRANAAFERAVAEREAAQRALSRAQGPARTVDARLAADQDDRRRQQELVIFAIRLAAAIVFLIVAYWLLARLRERESRYLPAAGAGVAFATIFAFVVAVDYLTDYFDPFDMGLLFLSLLGVLTTLAAFWVLQRYLRRRLPLRRVRRSECPYCGFPVRENERCEGCGREVIGSCARCQAPRRVGTPFCGACGAA